MSEKFKNIPTSIPEPNPDKYKNKRRTMLTDIGFKWYINKIIDKPTPIRIPRLINGAQKRG